MRSAASAAEPTARAPAQPLRIDERADSSSPWASTQPGLYRDGASVDAAHDDSHDPKERGGATNFQLWA
jgi:hypothetical protein